MSICKVRHLHSPLHRFAKVRLLADETFFSLVRIKRSSDSDETTDKATKPMTPDKPATPPASSRRSPRH